MRVFDGQMVVRLDFAKVGALHDESGPSHRSRLGLIRSDR
jgi:hypothetical protein